MRDLRPERYLRDLRPERSELMQAWETGRLLAVLCRMLDPVVAALRS